MLAIDKIAYASRLSAVSIGEKLCFILLPLLCALFAGSNLLNIVIILCMCPVTLYFSRMRFRNYLKLLLLPASFIIISIITLCIIPVATTHDSAIFSFELFGNAYMLSLNSLRSAMQIFYKSLAAISCLYFLALNTPINSLLAYLQRLGVSSLLLTLMEFIYRFIFILYEQACIMHTAQASRLGHSNFFKSIRAYYQLFACVFLRSLVKVERVNNALISRGFDSNFQHFEAQQEHSTQLQKLTCGYTLLFFCVFFLERGCI